MHLELYRKDRPTSSMLPNLPVLQMCYVFKPGHYLNSENKSAQECTWSSQVNKKRRPSSHSGSQDDGTLPAI